jgi:hypothetical protein
VPRLPQFGIALAVPAATADHKEAHMSEQHGDPLALRRVSNVRVTITLPRATHLALFHYCLACGADATCLARAASRIVAEYLAHDAPLKRWRAAQGASLPAVVPSRSRRGGRRA